LASNAILVVLFNVPLAAAAGALLWCSLSWPLVGDAAIFHFIARRSGLGTGPAASGRRDLQGPGREMGLLRLLIADYLRVKTAAVNPSHPEASSSAFGSLCRYETGINSPALPR
jgi:hypothetical protein